MPELHYRDHPRFESLGMAGQQFSQAATALQRLKLMQLQQQRDDMYRNAELGIRQQEFQTKQAEAQQSMEGEKELRNRSTAFSNAIKNLYQPRGGLRPGEEGPPSPEFIRQGDVQNAEAALAYILAQRNPASAQRMMEPQQFTPGSTV